MLKYGTKQLSVEAAKVFKNSLSLADSATTKKSSILYCVLSGSSDWTDEPLPDDVSLKDNHTQYEIMRNAIGAKKITEGNVSHVVQRYNWTTGTIYDMYRDFDDNIHDAQFYVVTDEYNVYKCLSNNKGAISTVKPNGFSTLPFGTSDGYVWKYMYTISFSDADKFMTTNYIPVKTLTATDGSTEQDRQIAVQNAAVNGAIHIIETVNIGSGYKELANGVVAAATSTTVQLSTTGSPSPIDNYYNGDSVYFSTGTGVGQLRRIIDYVGSTKTLVVNTAFSTIANTDTRVIISPSITIIGDGSGAKAYCRVSQSGAIANVIVISTGTKYTTAKALITSNTTTGSGATANVIITPVGGHGSDPVRELGADKLLLNIQIRGTEGISANGNGYIPANTEFRTVSILKDPILKVDANNNRISIERIANTSNSPNTLRLTHRMTISYLQMSGSNPVNPLLPQDIITNERNRLKAELGTLEFVTEMNPTQREIDSLDNAVQGANGHIVYIREDETESDASFYTVYLNSVDSYSTYAPFVVDDVILKSDSATSVATVEAIKGPEANTYSGKVLYTENIQTVTKNLEQSEDIKIILDF